MLNIEDNFVKLFTWNSFNCKNSSLFTKNVKHNFKGFFKEEKEKKIPIQDD
jgi:hypothetical protein